MGHRIGAVGMPGAIVIAFAGMSLLNSSPAALLSVGCGAPALQERIGRSERV